MNNSFVLVARSANYFPEWAELSAREQALCYYSDTHKEAYGFRPRGISPLATAGQLARMTRGCVTEIHRQIAEEREMEKARVREANARALAKRRHAAKVASGFTVGARWP